MKISSLLLSALMTVVAGSALAQAPAVAVPAPVAAQPKPVQQSAAAQPVEEVVQPSKKTVKAKHAKAEHAAGAKKAKKNGKRMVSVAECDRRVAKAKKTKAKAAAKPAAPRHVKAKTSAAAEAQ